MYSKPRIYRIISRPTFPTDICEMWYEWRYCNEIRPFESSTQSNIFEIRYIRVRYIPVLLCFDWSQNMKIKYRILDVIRPMSHLMEGTIRTEGKPWQVLIALMPPTKFVLYRPDTFGGEDIFVKYQRTDGRTPDPFYEVTSEDFNHKMFCWCRRVVVLCLIVNIDMEVSSLNSQGSVVPDIR